MYCGLCCFVTVLLDPSHIDMGYEIVRVGALEHQHLEHRVGLGASNEGDQIADQLRPDEIHGRSRDRRKQNGSFLAHHKRLEIHGDSPPAMDQLDIGLRTLAAMLNAREDDFDSTE
jgi:hypothetical protein